MKGCNQMSNNNYATTTNGLPIIYRDFESTAGSHIDSVLEELKEFAEEKINNIMIVCLSTPHILMDVPLTHP